MDHFEQFRTVDDATNFKLLPTVPSSNWRKELRSLWCCLKVRGHLVADLDPMQIKFGNGTLFYNRQGQPDTNVVRDYLIQIESKTLHYQLYTNILFWSKVLSQKPENFSRKHYHDAYGKTFLSLWRWSRKDHRMVWFANINDVIVCSRLWTVTVTLFYRPIRRLWKHFWSLNILLVSKGYSVTWPSLTKYWRTELLALKNKTRVEMKI